MSVFLTCFNNTRSARGQAVKVHGLSNGTVLTSTFKYIPVVMD